MFTVKKDVVHKEQIRKSRFIGHLAPVDSVEKAKEFISTISAEYRDASYNCWAYITGYNGEKFHYSDAGEPSGTAGKPILTAMQRNGLSNSVIVVTRFFGGVKLGIRGLIEAYRQITEETINKADLREMILKDFYEITTGYPEAEKLKYDLQEMGFDLLTVDYQKDVTLKVSILFGSNVREYLNNSQNAGILTFRYLKTDLSI